MTLNNKYTDASAKLNQGSCVFFSIMITYYPSMGCVISTCICHIYTLNSTLSLIDDDLQHMKDSM